MQILELRVEFPAPRSFRSMVSSVATSAESPQRRRVTSAPPSHLSATATFFSRAKIYSSTSHGSFFFGGRRGHLSRHKYPTERKATTELSAHNKMSVDFSTAELRTILRAHPGRKRDGTVRPRGEQAIRTMMSAITTHYRRVHGESSGSLGDLTWITTDSFVQPSQAVNIASVTDLAASGQRRLADNLRSALMSATAHIGASPDLSQDEKNRLRNAWDAEYRGLTENRCHFSTFECRTKAAGTAPPPQG